MFSFSYIRSDFLGDPSFTPNTGGIHTPSSEETLGFGEGNRKSGTKIVVAKDIKEERVVGLNWEESAPPSLGPKDWAKE